MATMGEAIAAKQSDGEEFRMRTPAQHEEKVSRLSSGFLSTKEGHIALLGAGSKSSLHCQVGEAVGSNPQS